MVGEQGGSLPGDMAGLCPNIQKLIDAGCLSPGRCRPVPTLFFDCFRQPGRRRLFIFDFLLSKRTHMPIIAWLLGVPISVIILLMLFGVF
ncbi:hypothetical protein B0B52_07340 [Polaromonas sp. A23]|nr:hypothetical protein B0B52_07340 [Polaromonas sp. A23]